MDVEQLLNVLNRLMTKENDPLLAFYLEKKFFLECDEKSIKELAIHLQNFIRDRVVVKDQSKLAYLKELLKFDKPIEIFSTNYDTCVEQITHSAYMTYTDGFDVYWNAENFNKKYDLKHYKMHGSAIWYEDEQTKECVKIPVVAFQESEPVKLQLIYGEDVKPLLIYPAQKSEYVEPLTELQLMFKNTLLKRTRILVVVGYSFRDDYIVHMLWDAARINNDLHIILVSPDAQQVFEQRLKYINKDKSILSRIHDRVICLPYPFSTAVGKLKNHYVREIETLLVGFKENEERLREEIGPQTNWEYLIKMSISVEFLTKTESILQLSKKEWKDLQFVQQQQLLLSAFKAMLHSVICRDGSEDIWLKRTNDTFRVFSVDQLTISGRAGAKATFALMQNQQTDIKKFSMDWIAPLIEEKNEAFKRLSPKYEDRLNRIGASLTKLEDLYNHLDNLAKGVVWGEELASDSEEIKVLTRKLKASAKAAHMQGYWLAPEPDNLITEIEKKRLSSFLGGDSFEFRLQ